MALSLVNIRLGFFPILLSNNSLHSLSCLKWLLKTWTCLMMSRTLRGYIDEENERFAQEKKEAKSKLAVAKEKVTGKKQGWCFFVVSGLVGSILLYHCCVSCFFVYMLSSYRRRVLSRSCRMRWLELFCQKGLPFRFRSTMLLFRR